MQENCETRTARQRRLIAPVHESPLSQEAEYVPNKQRVQHVDLEAGTPAPGYIPGRLHGAADGFILAFLPPNGFMEKLAKDVHCIKARLSPDGSRVVEVRMCYRCDKCTPKCSKHAEPLGAYLQYGKPQQIPGGE